MSLGLAIFRYFCRVRVKIGNRGFVPALALLAVFGMIMANSMLFMHAHKRADGTIIVHAHPFQKNSDSEQKGTNRPTGENHHHDNKDYLVLQHSTDPFLVADAMPASILAPAVSSEHISHGIEGPCPYLSQQNSRAPPLC
jgi:hypothetical protein